VNYAGFIMSKYLVILHDAQESSQAGRAELKLRIVDRLQVSQKTVEALFQSLPVIIRRDLEKNAADRYCRVLEGLGAVVEVMEQVVPVESLPEEQLLSPEAPGAVADNIPPSSPLTADDDEAELALNEEIDELEHMLDDALAGTQQSGNAMTMEVAGSAADSEDATFRLQDRNTDQARPPSLFDDLIRFEATEMNGSEASVSHFQEQKQLPDEESGDAVQAVPTAEFGEPNAFDSGQDIHAPAFPTHSQSSRQAKHVLLACVSLLAVVVLFFSKDTLFALAGVSPETISFTIDVDQLIRDQASILAEEKFQPVVHHITGHYGVETEDHGRQLKVRFTEVDRQLVRAVFSLSLPPPPPLSERDLVAGKPLPVWMKRVEAENLRLLQGPDPLLERYPRSQVFSGVGHAYFQQGRLGSRLSVSVRIFILPQPSADEKRQAVWIVSRAEDDGAVLPENVLQPLSINDYQLFFQDTVELHRESSEKTHAPL
jgi:hypothetical protein